MCTIHCGMRKKSGDLSKERTYEGNDKVSHSIHKNFDFILRVVNGDGITQECERAW
jgi:hypothetical protein